MTGPESRPKQVVLESAFSLTKTATVLLTVTLAGVEKCCTYFCYQHCTKVHISYSFLVYSENCKGVC